LDRLLTQAPEGFDDRFLEWVYHLGDQLTVKFANWGATDSEQADQYARAIGQRPPAELAVYYRHADPVGFLQDGWRRWQELLQEYRSEWVQALVDIMGTTREEARKQVNASPPLWPIDVFETRLDWVGFVWRHDEIAVMGLDLRDRGRGRADSIGLRNHFLRDVVIELLAEDEATPDFDRLGEHPMALAVGGWPKEPPFPEHVALVINRMLG